MSGKKKGNIANPDLHSSESPAKDGNELKNRINETAQNAGFFWRKIPAFFWRKCIDKSLYYDIIQSNHRKHI